MKKKKRSKKHDKLSSKGEEEMLINKKKRVRFIHGRILKQEDRERREGESKRQKR